MWKPPFRVKRYANAKYKFLVRGKVEGKWKRRYFATEAEAIAFAEQQNTAAEKMIPPRLEKDGTPTSASSVPVADPARDPRLQSSPGFDFTNLITPVYLGPRIDRYLGDAWCMHLPFAYDLMREFAPKTFVELGVKEGESYFAFCQSAAENKISVRCYGIDSWRGDIQTGKLSPQIAEEVADYNWQYSSFSELKQMLFAKALDDFADGTIDLLHIDGAHTYNDVKTDFESWLPKVSPNGLVLFHDVMVRDHGFGVWKVWEQIAREDNSFLFEFGFGLGVWKKQPVRANDSSFVRSLFCADKAERGRINESYANAAAALALWENLAHQFPPKKQDSRFTIEAEERTTEIIRFQREADAQARQTAQAQRGLEEKAKQVADLQRQLEENKEQLAQLQREGDDKSKEAARLQRDLEQKSREASNFERDVSKTSEEVANIRQENAELQQENAGLRQDNTELQRANTELQQENAELRQENADLGRERDKQAHSLVLLKNQLAATQERLEQTSVDILEAQWESLTLRRDSVQSEPHDSSPRILELESRTAVAESERDHLRVMLSALQKELDSERNRVQTAAMASASSPNGPV